MKKTMVITLLLLCMITLFAATTTQTITLVSVVKEAVPCFTMEVVNVRNGNSNFNSNEATIRSCDIKKDVSTKLNIVQTLSRFTGSIELNISFTELTYNGFSTSGARVSGFIKENYGRSGYTTTSSNSIDLVINYNGIPIDNSVAAEVFIEYNGNSTLPKGEYVSCIRMSYAVK